MNEEDDLHSAQAQQQQEEHERLLREDPDYAKWSNDYDNETRRQREMKPRGQASDREFKKVPPGNHIAICNAVIDLGLQPGSARYPDPKYQVYIRFEIPEERLEYEKDGETIEGPMSIGNIFTNSMHEKSKLRPFIQSWRGAPFASDDEANEFDFEKLLGQKCMLNITHNESGGKTYANIVTAAPLPRGMPSEHKPENPLLAYDPREHNEEVYQQLPKWIKGKLEQQVENEDHYSQKRANDRVPGSDDEAEPPAVAAGGDAGFDDDIPF